MSSMHDIVDIFRCYMEDVDNAATLREYQQLEADVRYLTGWNFRQLLKLFAAGWTLTPPEEPKSMLEEIGELKG